MDELEKCSLIVILAVVFIMAVAILQQTFLLSKCERLLADYTHTSTTRPSYILAELRYVGNESCPTIYNITIDYTLTPTTSTTLSDPWVSEVRIREETIW